MSNDPGDDTPVEKSLLVDRLAETGHDAVARYAAARGVRLPTWADLDAEGRNRARVLVLALFTRAGTDVDRLRRLLP